MSKIGNKQFVSFITAGDPSLAKTKEFVEVLADYSDIIEVGLPFSDPLAEGAVIFYAETIILLLSTLQTKTAKALFRM